MTAEIGPVRNGRDDGAEGTNPISGTRVRTARIDSKPVRRKMVGQGAASCGEPRTRNECACSPIRS